MTDEQMDADRPGDDLVDAPAADETHGAPDGDEPVGGGVEPVIQSTTSRGEAPGWMTPAVFHRMHPIGWVAVALAALAVVANALDWRFLIADLALWHWGVLVVMVVLALIPSALNGLRIGIEAIASLTKTLAWILAWAVFGLQLFNVITRYTNDWFEQDILFGETTSAAWQAFGLLFLLGVNYAVRDGVNPRIDFWWADFRKETKAWIDFILHAGLFLPFLIMALRLVVPFAGTSLGRKRDGSWPSGWQVWETWEQSADAGQLPVGPIQAALVIGFSLWALQIVAELIKTGFVMGGRPELGDIKESDAPLRVE